jgi:glutathione S-transferase
MRLYYHPASTTSRMITLFASEEGIDLDYKVVDLLTGEHLKPDFAAINPNCLVPALEDGDFRLTESSAILKYLAEKVGSAAYPKDLKERARVNEMMDWFNANLYKDLGYGLIYPQLFPQSQATQRRDSGRDGGLGKAESAGLVEDPRRASSRPQETSCLRRQGDLGGLLRRGDSCCG